MHLLCNTDGVRKTRVKRNGSYCVIKRRFLQFDCYLGGAFSARVRPALGFRDPCAM